MSFLNKSIGYISALTLYFILGGKILNNIFETFSPNLKVIWQLTQWTLSLIVLFYHFGHYGLRIKDKTTVLFFIAYSLFCYYYLTAGKVYKPEEMLAVPYTIQGFVQRSIYCLILILCSKTLYEKTNVKFLIMLLFLLCTIPSIAYIRIIGLTTLQVYGNLSREDQFVGLLTLGYVNAFVLTISYSYSKTLSTKKLWWMLMIIACIFASATILISSKRGPILWTLVTLACLYYLKTKKFRKVFFYGILLTLFVLLAWEYLLDLISNFAPYTAQRIKESIIEGNTAHRINTDGMDESVYGTAFSQVIKSPIIGSYFRIISSGYSHGFYPHNIFLELLITMGVLGTIPFIMMLFSRVGAILSNKYTVGTLSDRQLYGIGIFLSTFFTLQTTGSILLNYGFWATLGMLYHIPMSSSKMRKISRKKVNHK